MSKRRPSSILLMTIMLFESFTASAQTAGKVPDPPFSICINNNCTTTSTASTGIKWHPGHYVQSNSYIKGGSSDSSIAGLKADIDQALSGNANVAGYMALGIWAAIETSQGVYDWSGVDALRSYIATKYPGKRFGLAVFFVGYGIGNISEFIPNYVLNDSSYGSGYDGSHYGYWDLFGSGNSPTAAFWRPAVAARIKALFASLAAHTSPYGSGYTYDTDPYFEAVAWDESSLSLSSTGDYTNSAATAQWAAIHTSMVASFPHTNVIEQNNFWYAQGTSNAVNVMVADIAIGCAIGGPDVRPTYYGGYTDGQLAYIGDSSAGTSAQFGKAPYIAFVQSGDYVSGGVAAIMTESLSSLKSAQVWWSNLTLGNGVQGDWVTTVLPAINASPIPSANKVCPSNYGRRGGCNSL
jgi:hypothetical protein